MAKSAGLEEKKSVAAMIPETTLIISDEVGGRSSEVGTPQYDAELKRTPAAIGFGK